MSKHNKKKHNKQKWTLEDARDLMFGLGYTIWLDAKYTYLRKIKGLKKHEAEDIVYGEPEDESVWEATKEAHELREQEEQEE